MIKLMNTDIKLYALNVSAMAFSFTNIDDILKVVLLIVSIGYTTSKWWSLVKKNRDK